MSVNRYDASTGELVTLASGTRTWIGTKAAYDAAKSAGTLPNNCLIAITDDEEDHNHYSTDETFTGNYWIDGKKIYRKVLRNVTMPKGTKQSVATVNVPHGISNAGNFIVLEGMLRWSSGNQIKIPDHEPIDDVVVRMHVNATNVVLEANYDLTGYAANFIILEYTKTTD